nr:MULTISPECIES: 5-formyltetrahydrofolate cyclo-ligase [unclassified Rhodococcus (in: high G+C Gram-positive bacteria)]
MISDDKLEWRTRILTARKQRDVHARERASEALSHAVSVLASDARERGGDTLAAYVPVGSEPGDASMLDSALAAGLRVLLPVAREPGPLSWAEYRGPDSLVAAAYGLREPSGPTLPPETVADASIVLVPALAVDRSGGRLGRGAGFYDRTLDAVRPDAWLVGVVYDDDLVDALPTETHDVRMTHVLTPLSGLQRLVRDGRG